MSVVSTILAILSKDIMLDLRRKIELGGVAVFAIAAGVATSYILSFSTPSSLPSIISAGLILIMIFLAVFASLSSFIRESEQGTIDGLRVAPVSAEAVFIAKLIYSFLFILFQELVYVGSMLFFTQTVLLLTPSILVLVILLALFLAAASSFASALLVYSEARGILLPVTILVLVLPYIQFASPILVRCLTSISLPIADFITATAISLGFIAIVVPLSKYLVETI